MSQDTLFFYDLETSGVQPRSSRIMQFAGQRTSLDLKPIGEPVDLLIMLTPDVLPDPHAILLTGITPQKTLEEGITEAEFCKVFISDIAVPNTIFVGFNSLRFDDEFMRFLLWRNYYDPYEWQWKDGNSKWDMLDVVRMTRALRPDDIVWPFASNGAPSIRLELLTSVNKLSHTSAHDALSDVTATIAVADLIQSKQPKLFKYLFDMREKQRVTEFITENDMFVYTSGRYANEFEKTTVACPIMQHSDKGGCYVFDLRYDPADYLALSPEELAELWQYKKDRDAPRLPIKLLKYNRCPAVAPLGVLDASSRERLVIDVDSMKAHANKLKNQKEFIKNLQKALEILDRKRDQTALLSHEKKSEELLYDAFVSNTDRNISRAVRGADPKDILDLQDKFSDDRLKNMLPRYKARNYPKLLTPDEKIAWEAYCRGTLASGGEKSKLYQFSVQLAEIAARTNLTKNEAYLIEELQLYAQSLL